MYSRKIYIYSSEFSPLCRLVKLEQFIRARLAHFMQEMGAEQRHSSNQWQFLLCFCCLKVATWFSLKVNTSNKSKPNTVCFKGISWSLCVLWIIQLWKRAKKGLETFSSFKNKSMNEHSKITNFYQILAISQPWDFRLSCLKLHQICRFLRFAPCNFLEFHLEDIEMPSRWSLAL